MTSFFPEIRSLTGGLKMLSKIWIYAAALLLAAGTAAALTPQEQLGKDLFFDTNLSEPKGQACAVCHAPLVGFTGPNDTINKHGAVYEGAVNGRFGNRKPPTASYAGDSPVLHIAGNTWSGGMFWDGRATGLRLGDPLAEQAQGPFLNPLEQNNPNAAAVVEKVNASNYSDLFNTVCGSGLSIDAYYECIARSIAAYERSSEVSSFTSKFDSYIRGKASLTTEELRGLILFRGKGKCDRCHASTGRRPLFTDFTYDNLGVPRNPENRFYNELNFNPAGAAWIDTGLGGFLTSTADSSKARQEYGKEKVPTLRNVAKGSCEVEPDNPNCIAKAYSHNGYFKSLKEIVHFYNTRDVLPVCGFAGSIPGTNCWPLPELALNMNTKEVGNLRLTDGEENAIVAFLETLSDV